MLCFIIWSLMICKCTSRQWKDGSKCFKTLTSSFDFLDRDFLKVFEERGSIPVLEPENTFPGEGIGVVSHFPVRVIRNAGGMWINALVRHVRFADWNRCNQITVRKMLVVIQGVSSRGKFLWSDMELDMAKWRWESSIQEIINRPRVMSKHSGRNRLIF